MAMIDAWLDNDLLRLDELMDLIGGDFGKVFWHLIVVLGGTIQTIANFANQTFEDALPPLLAQIALRTEEEAANVAREALTAWCSGEEDLVADLGFDEAIYNAGPKLVLLHLLLMLSSISQSWANQTGFSMSDVREGWAKSLGTLDGDYP